MSNLNFLASTVPKILWGPKIQKVGHVSPHNPFDLILHFSSVLSVIHLYVELEVSSFNRLQDIRVVPKFQKWVT